MLLAILLALVAIGAVQIDQHAIIRVLAGGLLITALILAVAAEVPI